MDSSNSNLFKAASTAVAEPQSPRRRYEKLKARLEGPIALALLILTGPIILAAMFLVRLTSRGPALFSQTRLGLDGRVFSVYKIRTMHLDCERDTGPVWSLPGDSRVIPVGRFLRWSHIDELPQLFNILKGEMSLIGPRPERPEIAADLEIALPHYRRRLAVRPGLTGLAQVLQAPDTDVECVRRKLVYDRCYVEQMGLRLDACILVATVLLLLGVPSEKLGAISRLSEVDSRLDAQMAFTK
mgnify:CR=1 FL=1